MIWGPLARLLGRPLAAGTTDVSPADAIVVLGGPLRPDGRLSAVVEERVLAAVGLFERGIAPLVCLTGGPTRGAAVAEANVMAERARRAGVPDAALVVEARSLSTFENANNVAELLMPRGVQRVIVVSTPFHLRRGVRWFRRVGFEVEGLLIADSLQYTQPRRALRWIAREYASWIRSLAISGWRRIRGGR